MKIYPDRTVQYIFSLF